MALKRRSIYSASFFKFCQIDNSSLVTFIHGTDSDYESNDVSSSLPEIRDNQVHMSTDKTEWLVEQSCKLRIFWY